MKIKTLRRVRYNATIAHQYAISLKVLISEMVKSACYWAGAQYNAHQSGKRDMNDIATRLVDLRERWVVTFSDAALTIATKFVKAADNTATKSLKRSIGEKNLQTVKFTMTPEMKQAVDGIVAENVNLIKSIPEKYFTQVQTITLQSITRGRDLQYMTEELQKQFGVTRRRAERIALDQNNKATAELAKVRQQSLGITKGIWIHSGGGSHPRPKHVKANGQEFDLHKGLPVGDNGEYVLPGQEINCGCSWKPILPF